MTAEQMVQKLNRELSGNPVIRNAVARGWTNTEGVATTALPLVVLAQNDLGVYRVAGAVAYLNRCGNPQFTVFIQDFEDGEEAETLFLEILEADGFMAFGSEFRLSRGSGLRFVQDLS
jgi:hypothetical protein